MLRKISLMSLLAKPTIGGGHITGLSSHFSLSTGPGKFGLGLLKEQRML